MAQGCAKLLSPAACIGPGMRQLKQRPGQVGWIIPRCCRKEVLNLNRGWLKYLYIHTYIYIYIQIYTHTCIMYVHVRACTYIHTYMHTYMHTYTHTHTRTRTDTHVHLHMHMFVCIYLLCMGRLNPCSFFTMPGISAFKGPCHTLALGPNLES